LEHRRAENGEREKYNRRRKPRRLAEEALEEAPDDRGDLSEFSPEEMTGLIHELRVHQIELKMQNEELGRIQRELEKARDLLLRSICLQ
jgi:hypothetical protein